MIDHIPVTLEPPSPMPTPPLRRRPGIMPQFSTAVSVGPFFVSSVCD